MTNLKKITALSLAATSMLGTVASASTFPDAADINNFDAVTTLSALGIIKGDLTGNFNPTQTVTRAEMAKMIFTIVNKGDDNAEAFDAVTTDLTDISTHWASSYIKYCEQNGIVAGYGDGTFRPENEVTSAEALKMVLVALGYEADDYTGATWYNSVVTHATTLQLVDGVTSYNSASSRENAAQILYNALYADMAASELNSNQGASGYAYVTLGDYYLDLVTVTGFANGVGVGLVNISDTYNLQTNSDYYDGDLKATTDYIGYTGQLVDVLMNDKTNAVYGLKPAEDYVYSIDALKGALTIDTSSGSLSTYTVEYDGLKIKGLYENDWDAFNDADSNARIIIAKNGTADASIKTIPVDVAEVTSFSAGYGMYITDTAVGTSSFADWYEFEDTSLYTFGAGLEKDAFVTVYNNEFTGKVEFEVIETQSGKITATKVNDSAIDASIIFGTEELQYKINNNWYTVYSNADVDATTFDLGTTIEFSAIGSVIYGAEILVDATIDFSKYVAVVNVAQAKETSTYTTLSGNVAYWETQLLFSDGATKIVYVAAEDSTDKGTLTDAGDRPYLGLYTYKIIEGFYVLEPVIGSSISYDVNYYSSADTEQGLEKDNDLFIHGTSNNHAVIDDNSLFYVLTTKTDSSGNYYLDNDYYYFLQSDVSTIDFKLYYNTGDAVSIEAYKYSDYVGTPEILTGAEVKDWGDTDLRLSATVTRTINGVDHVIFGFMIADISADSDDYQIGSIWETTIEIDEDGYKALYVTMFTADSDNKTVTYKVHGTDGDTTVSDNTAATDFYYMSRGDVIFFTINSDDSITLGDQDDYKDGYNYLYGSLVGTTASNSYINVYVTNGDTYTIQLTDSTDYIYVNSKHEGLANVSGLTQAVYNPTAGYNENIIVIYKDNEDGSGKLDAVGIVTIANSGNADLLNVNNEAPKVAIEN